VKKKKNMYNGGVATGIISWRGCAARCAPRSIAKKIMKKGVNGVWRMWHQWHLASALAISNQHSSIIIVTGIKMAKSISRIGSEKSAISVSGGRRINGINKHQA